MKKALLAILFLLPALLFADIYKGLVVDEKGEPISYASVYVKNNPQSGTMTDSLGYYSIQIPNSSYSDNLVVSFIGYRTVEVSIASLNSKKIQKIILVEQPIMLEGAIVKAKISRKESRKLKKAALEKFVKQMTIDFPKRTAQYDIFSMYNGSQDDRQLMHHEIIGQIIEYPIADHHGGDSIALKVNSVKDEITDEIRVGYDKFNEITDERINGQNINKKIRGNKFKLSYTKRDLDAQALRMHRFLWGGQTHSLIKQLQIDKPNRWNYTLVDDEAVLCYTKKENYLGIFKAELQLYFYINPQTFQINKIAQSLKGELHIPFGYKLGADELEFINALQYGHDKIDKYRVRHAYVDVMRNVFFERQGKDVVVREKNLEVQGNIIDTKNKKLSYKAKAKVLVSGKPKIKNL